MVGLLKGLPHVLLDSKEVQAGARLFAFALEKNYQALFTAFEKLSSLESKLLGLTGFAEAFRLDCLRVILTAYRASGQLELSFLLTSLGFKNLNELVEFCERRKVQLALSEGKDLVDIKKTL